ncbi:hypothetical protein [Methylomonas sp. AM2-LC]|uniref:hypothetical protein n=1 Tax=Methylomonas sp. AM2-LC TaxID=3153301 RepID=UPI00326390B9
MSEESKKLNPKKLQSLAPFLRIDKIRPGDVLLTRGRAARSTFIAKATRGEFSHAAIFLPLEYALQPTLVEADGLGVGFTNLPLLFLSSTEFGNFSVYSIPDAPKAYKLLRHPAIESKTPKQLLKAASDLQEKVLFRRYSILSRLIKPVDLSDRIEEISEQVVKLMESRKGVSSHTGVFCSELVAMYFDALGITLFKKPRSAESVSPNHLDENSSLLKEVPEAFIDLSQLEHIEGELSDFCYPERKELLPAIVKQRQGTEDIIGKLKEFEALVQSRLSEQSIASQEMGQQIYDQIVQSATQAGDWGQYELVNKYLTFANEVYLWNHLEKQTYARDQQFSKPDVSFEERADWTQACLKLTEITLSLRSKTQRAYLRTSLLFSLKVIRHQIRDKTTSWHARLSLKRKRRAMLMDYRSHHATYAARDLLVSKLQKTEPLSPMILAHIEEVIRDAKLAAMMESGIDPDCIPENRHSGE